MALDRRAAEQALKAANKGREILGKKPVKRLKKGIRQDPCRCVIAATIGLKPDAYNSYEYGVYPYDGRYTRKARVDFALGDGRTVRIGGKLAADFACAFDYGQLPEYELLYPVFDVFES